MKATMNFLFKKRKASLLLFLNMALLYLSSLYFGDVSSGVLLLTLSSCLFQIYLSVYKKVYSACVPIEFMHEKLSTVFPRYLNLVALAISLTPVLSSLSLWFGILWMSGAVLISINGLLKIFARFINRKMLVETNKDVFKDVSPEIVVYVSGLKNAAYQVNQWLPVLERFEKKVAIIIRERRIYEGMVETGIPTFFVKTSRDLEYCLGVAGSVKTVLYPANPMKNLQALRHFKLNHFFINHGESDKAVNQSKLLMAYDKLLVGGPLAEKRLRDAGLPLRENQIEYVGRPQAEVLLDKADHSNEIKTILYAPTWEGFVENVNYSSVCPLGYEIIKSLRAEGSYRVIFKPHPYTGTRNKGQKQWLKKINEYCERNGVKIAGNMDSIHSLMNMSDLLITDISSVLNEYLVTGKPIVLCNVKNIPEEKLCVDFPSSKAAYIVTENDDVVALVDAISNEDVKEIDRDIVRSQSLSKFPEGALVRFVNLVENP